MHKNAALFGRRRNYYALDQSSTVIVPTLTNQLYT